MVNKLEEAILDYRYLYFSCVSSLLKVVVFFLFSFGTERSVRPISPDSVSKLEKLLRALAEHYRYRGINLRTECEHFDWHNIGVINESQVIFFLALKKYQYC